MTVYVDDMYKYPLGQFRRMKMSHMVADTTEELLAMADAIGVNRRWIQYPGTEDEHFDIAMAKRALAVKNGAVEITMRECAFFVRGRKELNPDLGGSAAPPGGVVWTSRTPVTQPNRRKPQMQITIDTNNLSELDINMLAFLAEQGESATEDEVTPEPTPAPAKKAKAEPTPKPEPEPEVEEDLVGGEGPTLSQAIARATELVSEGQAAKVKTALAEVGVKRVSDLEEKDIASFLALLPAE